RFQLRSALLQRAHFQLHLDRYRKGLAGVVSFQEVGAYLDQVTVGDRYLGHKLAAQQGSIRGRQIEEPVLIQNRLDAGVGPRDGPVVEDQVVADAPADSKAFALDDGIIRLIQLVLPAYYESALRFHRKSVASG